MRGGGRSWGEEHFLPPNRGTARATPSQGRMARISSAPRVYRREQPQRKCPRRQPSGALPKPYPLLSKCTTTPKSKQKFSFPFKKYGGQKKKKKVKKFLFCTAQRYYKIRGLKRHCCLYSNQRFEQTGNVHMTRSYHALGACKISRFATGNKLEQRL